MKSGQLRDLRRMVEAEGLVLAETSRTGGDHLRLTVKRGDGVARDVIVGTTSSDRRADLNSRAELRRFAKGWAPQPPAPARPRPAKPAPPASVAPPIEPPAAPAPTPAAEPQRPPVEPARQEKPLTRTFTRSALSHADFYRLCEWLKSSTLEGLHTLTDAAKAAGDALTLEIGASSVSSALEAVGKTLPERTSTPANRGDRTAVVARELENLLRELGKDPSAALMAVARRDPLPAN